MIEIDIGAWAILLIVGLCALLEDSIGLRLILPAEAVLLAAAAARAVRSGRGHCRHGVVRPTARATPRPGGQHVRSRGSRRRTDSADSFTTTAG